MPATPDFPAATDVFGTTQADAVVPQSDPARRAGSTRATATDDTRDHRTIGTTRDRGRAEAGSVPERLLALLDRLGAVLAERGDAVALLGLGSVGRDRHRLDEHSDADLFVVVDDGCVARYLTDIDWLEATAPVAWSFEHTHDGRKVLFADGLFAEYAVFTVTELRGIPYPPARLLWARDDAADDAAGFELARVPLPSAPTVEHQVGEALTNLFVGLHRDLRGERLSATRFVQGYALDRLLTVLDLLGAGRGEPQDAFAVERGAERRFGPVVLPLDVLNHGYGPGRNAAAALAILALLEARVEVEPSIAGHIRALAERAGQVSRALPDAHSGA